VFLSAREFPTTHQSIRSDATAWEGRHRVSLVEESEITVHRFRIIEICLPILVVEASLDDDYESSK
jgi:hypothetical protein